MHKKYEVSNGTQSRIGFTYLCGFIRFLDYGTPLQFILFSAKQLCSSQLFLRFEREAFYELISAFSMYRLTLGLLYAFVLRTLRLIWFLDETSHIVAFDNLLVYSCFSEKNMNCCGVPLNLET